MTAEVFILKELAHSSLLPTRDLQTGERAFSYRALTVYLSVGLTVLPAGMFAGGRGGGERGRQARFQAPYPPASLTQGSQG